MASLRGKPASVNDQVSLEHRVKNSAPPGTRTRLIPDIILSMPSESVWLTLRYAKTQSKEPSA